MAEDGAVLFIPLRVIPCENSTSIDFNGKLCVVPDMERSESDLLMSQIDGSPAKCQQMKPGQWNSQGQAADLSLRLFCLVNCVTNLGLAPIKWHFSEYEGPCAGEV